MTYLEETENYILSTVRNALLDVGDILDWNRMQSANIPPHIWNLRSKAFNGLIAQGFFDKDGRLTEAGYDCAYNITSPTQKLDEAKTYILSTVQEAHLDVGDILDWNRMQSANIPPHIWNLRSKAFNGLIAQGFFDKDGRLTEAGYDCAYNITSPTQKLDDAKNHILLIAKNVQRCDVGEIFDERCIRFADIPPHIWNLRSKAFKELIAQGLFDEDGSLTQQGYDKLYS